MNSDNETLPTDIPLFQSQVLRLIVGAGLMVVALVVGNTIWSIGYERRQIINEFRNNTLAIGITIAPHISLDGLLGRIFLSGVLIAVQVGLGGWL